MAVAAARPAGDAGARHRGQGQRPGDRHAWPVLLHPRQHLGAAAGETPATTSEPLVLFDPADAVRSVSRGVFIDYYLKDAADKVTIEILDPQGKLIRTYTGPQRRRQRPARPAEMEEGEDAPRQGPAGAGRRRQGHEPVHVGHALSERASTFPGMIMWAASTRGPAAPPGRYQVRVTAGGCDQDAGLRDPPQCRRARPSPTPTCRRSSRWRCRSASGCRRRTAPSIRIRDIKTQITDRTAKVDRSGREDGGAGAHRQADRGRRGDLPASAAQRPGSAELPDPVEQQAGGAAGHGRERRLSADRRRRSRCSRNCPAGSTSSWRGSTRSSRPTSPPSTSTLDRRRARAAVKGGQSDG